LTNGIDGIIYPAMNTSEQPRPDNPRLKRIQKVGGIAKWMVYVFLLYETILFLLFTGRSPADHVFSLRGVLMVSYLIIVYVWYWNLARLFKLYERGKIFAAQTIRCIKTLGILWAAGWLLLTAVHLLPKPVALTPAIAAYGVTPVSVVKHTYRFGFFTCDFGTGIDFGGLLTASVIVLIAWIMDEGRKIQEEQDLTV
jgi:hypothetical protein